MKQQRGRPALLRSPPPDVHGRTFQRWERMCGRKVAFSDPREAAKKAAQHGRHMYRCGYGPHWHLTSKAPSPETNGAA